MPRHAIRTTFFAAVLLLGAAALITAQEGPAPGPGPGPGPAPGPAAEDFSGRLEAGQATEVKVDLKNYSGELRLKMVLAPGMKVAAGDLVAQLDATDYERALKRATENADLAAQSLQAAQDAAGQYPAALALQIAKSQRDLDRATELLKFFQETDKKNRIRSGEMGIESGQNNIEDQEEELKQLQELYHGNNLAKESQDIVLNRSKRRLAQTKERFEMQKASHKRFMEVDIPRQEQDLITGLEAAKLEMERVKNVQEHGNVELNSRMARARQADEDAKRALADLNADKGAFELKAPHAGVLVVGGLAGNNSISTSVKAGDKLRAGQAVCAVVDWTKMGMTFGFGSAAFGKVAVGGNVEIKTADNVVATGKILAVGFMVDGRGRLSATLEVENAEGKLLPGTKAGVKLVQ